jgi:antitoxin Phd
MNIDTKKIVSISEANQNFSKVARMVEKNGEVYIFKNNKPKYRIVDLENDTSIEMTDDEKIDFAAARILKQYRRASEELAK